ncbi:DUF5753 domain-containing protein [Nocardia sp. NPDC049737]|uniref:DUF5753 domain-containing protein n=1 Tax=Nocardia sp. NPDC049737 TaxID=3154358 RepID=UPI00341AD5C0
MCSRSCVFVVSDVDRLTRRNKPATYTAVLHESVLRTVIRSRKVMAAQLRNPADLSSHPNVDIRVLPFRAGLSTGPFLILDFDVDRKGKPEEPSPVYVESFTGGIFLERPADLDRYREAYGVLRREALDARPSRDLLRKLRRSSNVGVARLWRPQTRPAIRPSDRLARTR